MKNKEKGSANLHVCTPQEQQWKPLPRQAAWDVIIKKA